jgi:hypothetical protein
MQNQTMPPISNIVFNDDRDFVLYLLQHDPFALRYNFPKLQDDLDFAFAAVEAKAIVLPFVSERLQNDFKLVKKAIEYHPWTLIFASTKLRKRYYFQEILMKRDPEIFLCQSSEYILSTKLKIETSQVKIETSQVEAIHLIHCTRDHHYFKKLPKSIQLNEEFALKAIEANFHVFQSLPNQLKKNENFVKIAFSKTSDIYRYLPEHLKNDQAFSITAIQKNIDNFQYLPISLKQSHELIYIYHLLMIDGLKILKYDHLKNNKDFVKVAIQQNPDVLLDLPNELMQDDDLIHLVFNSVNLDKFYVPSYLSMNQALEMIELNPLYLRHFKFLQYDPVIVNKAIAKNELSCLYASDSVITSSMINDLEQHIHQTLILNNVSHDIEQIKSIFQILYYIEEKRKMREYSFSQYWDRIIHTISNQYPNIYDCRFKIDLSCNIVSHTNCENNHHAVYQKSHDDLQYKILLFKQTLASARQSNHLSKEQIEVLKLQPYREEILKINQQQKIEIPLTQSFGLDTSISMIETNTRRR